MVLHLTEKMSEKIAEIALKSLLYEVSVTPKPGLVDRRDSGAHRDMDFFTFLDSACALKDYFYQTARAGCCYEGGDLKALFNSIRPVGIAAEKEMFKATGGVNTHKGLIFSLGIITCAAGYSLTHERTGITGGGISKLVMAMTEGVSRKDLGKLDPAALKTNGEKIYLQYGVGGIRAEAERGFPTALTVGLSALNKALGAGLSINDAGVQCLLSIMTVLEDTNVIARQGFETLALVKDYGKKALMMGGMASEEGKSYIRNVNQIFIDKNISPGGAADNLAISFCFYFMENTDLYMA